MAITQNKIFTFGGLDTTQVIRDSFHEFDLTKKVWEKRDPVNGIKPLPRTTFSMFSTESKVIIHGGLGSNG
jgi:N-acetylneuraminic acid mutarotase